MGCCFGEADAVDWWTGDCLFYDCYLPIFTTGGVQLFSAETTGVTHDRTHPKINVMAKWLWTVYLILTVSETILLMFGGMDLFDAICQSFATTATGGYSTKQNSYFLLEFSVYRVCCRYRL